MVRADDAELVARAARGDGAAFRRLLERYVNLAGATAYAILGDYETSRDAVQETFTRIFRLLPKVREPDRFRHLVVRVARSVALDFRRRGAAAKRGRAALFSQVAGAAEQGPLVVLDADAATPSEMLEREEVRALVRAGIEALPEQYREVVMLHHIDGLSCEEVARLLGRSRAAVEALLHRARAALRARLARHLRGLDRNDHREV